jgi:shikimate dehydrogenase
MYGIIGFPLSHSFSPAYFKEQFKKTGRKESYRSFPLQEIDELPALILDNPVLKGLNVTIPYKEAVLPFLEETDATARETGAVNCIKIINGKLKGFNTDVTGFSESLRPLLNNRRKALVLGTGGAAKAVAWSLKALEIEFQFVSRQPAKGQLGYMDLSQDIIAAHPLIVNATPLGMYPRTGTAPDIPYSFLSKHHLLYDLVYNPQLTLFLQKGAEQGAAVKNGYEMLIRQADASLAIWDEK